MAKLLKEYDSIEKLTQNQNSMGSYLKENIEDYKLYQSHLNKNTELFIKNSSYSRPQEAISNWDSLVKKYKLEKTVALVEKSPEILGELSGNKILFFSNKDRTEAIKKIGQSINILINNSQLKDTLNIAKASVKNLDTKCNDIYKENFKFKTSNISYSKMKKEIEEGVKKSLQKINSIESKNIVKTIAKRVEEKIIAYKTRYQKEPNISDKISIFLNAKHEYEIKSFYKEKLNNESQAETKIEKINRYQQIDKLSKIDANLSQQNNSRTALNNPDQNNVTTTYDYYLQRAENLTGSYIKQGYENNQAKNIANKIIGYEIANNKHIDMKNLKVAESQSKTFNLDKTIISNMGITENDSLKLLSKIESLESERIDSKQKKELGFSTSNTFTQNHASINKEQEINKDAEKSYEVSKDVEISM